MMIMTQHLMMKRLLWPSHQLLRKEPEVVQRRPEATASSK